MNAKEKTEQALRLANKAIVITAGAIILFTILTEILCPGFFAVRQQADAETIAQAQTRLYDLALITNGLEWSGLVAAFTAYAYSTWLIGSKYDGQGQKLFRLGTLALLASSCPPVIINYLFAY